MEKKEKTVFITCADALHYHEECQFFKDLRVRDYCTLFNREIKDMKRCQLCMFGYEGERAGAEGTID